jgi:outer membrane protein OmpU
MNNFKKIGMTALAASLVSTSVFAGELAVSGSASIAYEIFSGTAKDSTKSFSMGNQITFSGSGELDNGMNVSLSFVIDEGDNVDAAGAVTSSVFDSHSVTVSSDALGTLVFHGEGGDSAQAAVGDTAAGNIWDNFDGKGGTTVRESRSGDNMMHYTLPSMVDGVTLAVSYSPATGEDESDSAYALTYTGIEGLSVSYGAGSNDGQAAGSGGSTANTDVTSIKASYAYGPVTIAYSDHESDSNTATADQDATSFKLSYTISDALSVSYAEEEIDSNGAAETSDAEYSKVVASYTSGGMTISANYQEADNTSYTTAVGEDYEYAGVSLSFAF